MKNWIFILFVIYFLNYFNKLFLGDNGSYFLGFIYSFILINIYLQNQYLSTFFIILMLLYPAFENLFSLVRKLNFKKSAWHVATHYNVQLPGVNMHGGLSILAAQDKSPRVDFLAGY